MKKILTAFVLAYSFIGFSQNYQPFDQNSSKRFFETGNPSNNDFFFHATDESTFGDTLILNQYYTLRDNGNFNDIPECNFWGGASGVELDTTWLGNQLRWNQLTKQLMLRNEQNELLSFDFGMGLGATTTFYANGAIEYRIEHTSTMEETFYGVTDSIQHYTIQAYDNGGNSITSTLNNFEIQLSKNYGLISFINCYDFPMLEQGVELEGQTNPTVGHYQLTYDECYPWVAGDVVQYSTNNSYVNPPAHKIAYQTVTVTNRIENADSVKIYLSSVLQEVNPALPITPFVALGGSVVFRKGTVVSEKPWNMSQEHPKLSKGSESPLDWCGYLSTFSSDEEFSAFCDSCRCYGNYDGFSQSVTEERFAASIGRYKVLHKDYGYPGNGGSRRAQLIYSNINGVECGTLWNNVDELNTFNLELFPNPTNDLITINSEFQIKEITIRDFSGRVILELSNINQKETTLSLADLHNGAYIVEIKANNSAQKKTIFKH